jgi:hypothetical protein
MTTHVGRTGDYDALLILFMTAYSLCFWTFHETKENRYLVGFLACLLVAIFTKSIAAFLPLPFFVFYTIREKKLSYFFKNSYFYIGVFFLFISVTAYYYYRETVSAGFLKAVWENEIAGRYLEVMEYDAQKWYYYFRNLVLVRFKWWWLLSLVAVGYALFYRNNFPPLLKRFLFFIIGFIAAFLCIITISQTKLAWYDAPIYPFLALLNGWFLYEIFSIKINHSILNILKSIFLIGLLSNGYYQRWLAVKGYQIEHDWEKNWDYICFYLRKAAKENRADLDGSYLVRLASYSAHVRFYQAMLKHKNINIPNKDIEALQKGDKIITDELKTQTKIENTYSFKLLETAEKIKVYEIL